MSKRLKESPFPWSYVVVLATLMMCWGILGLSRPLVLHIGTVIAFSAYIFSSLGSLYEALKTHDLREHKRISGSSAVLGLVFLYTVIAPIYLEMAIGPGWGIYMVPMVLGWLSLNALPGIVLERIWTQRKREKVS